VQSGLVPVSIGLIGASAFVLARATDHSVAAGVLTVLTAVVAFATRLNPLWIFGAGALAGLFGWL
jgi:chromate transporter